MPVSFLTLLLGTLGSWASAKIFGPPTDGRSLVTARLQAPVATLTQAAAHISERADAPSGECRWAGGRGWPSLPHGLPSPPRSPCDRGIGTQRQEIAMGLRTPQQYVESLRDGRVTYWDGERIDDITTHPRFRVPIALTAVDYEYDAADYGALRRYRTETGEEAHRIYQVPTSEADLATRVELLQHTSIGTAVSGVYMALMSVKDDVAQVNPQC